MQRAALCVYNSSKCKPVKSTWESPTLTGCCCYSLWLCSASCLRHHSKAGTKLYLATSSQVNLFFSKLKKIGWGMLLAVKHLKLLLVVKEASANTSCVWNWKAAGKQSCLKSNESIIVRKKFSSQCGLAIDGLSLEKNIPTQPWLFWIILGKPLLPSSVLDSHLSNGNNNDLPHNC